MRKGVNINGVSRAAPCFLDLLGNLLGVGWGENTCDAGITEVIRQRIQQLGDSVGEANRSEYAGS